VSAASEQRRKHGTGEKNPAGGGSTRLKGGRGRRGGGAGSQAMRGVEWGRQRGARALYKMARAAGIGPRPVSACGAVAALQRRAAGREQLTGGTGRPQGPAGSNGVWGEHDRTTRC
jgi:hypothetical protein